MSDSDLAGRQADFGKFPAQSLGPGSLAVSGTVV